MKILTKFITSSVLVIVGISCLIWGEEIVIKQLDRSLQVNSERNSQELETIFKAQLYLKDELRALKDLLIFNRLSIYITQYEKARSDFLSSLAKLASLLPQNSVLQSIRDRHQLLNNFAKSIQKNNSHLPSQASFQKINSFRDNIFRDFQNLETQIKAKENLEHQEDVKLKQKIDWIRRSIIITIILMFIGQLLLIILPLINSIEKLKQGILILGAGNLDYQIKVETGDEIEKLAKEFNQMAMRLSESYYCLKQEISDRQITEKELQQALEKLQKTQSQLIQTEKMSALGNTVAGVAHEINNPISFIYGNLGYLKEYTQSLLDLIQLYQKYYPQPEPTIQKYIEDIDFDFLNKDLIKIIASMKVGAERIRQIVLSLRNFAHLDESELKEVDIHQGMDNTLSLLQNRLIIRDNPIKVVTKYGKLPLVECYPRDLNQVFMNILLNAIEALETKWNQMELEQSLDSQVKFANEKPEIRIRTQILQNNAVVVLITDNGIGMTENVLRKLFDPFFTTKPVGKGIGLGLSISYQIIVQKHSGVLRCNSTLNQGTEFWIEIPLQQSQQPRVNGS